MQLIQNISYELLSNSLSGLPFKLLHGAIILVAQNVLTHIIVHQVYIIGFGIINGFRCTSTQVVVCKH